MLSRRLLWLPRFTGAHASTCRCHQVMSAICLFLVAMLSLAGNSACSAGVTHVSFIITTLHGLNAQHVPVPATCFRGRSAGMFDPGAWMQMGNSSPVELASSYGSSVMDGPEGLVPPPHLPPPSGNPRPRSFTTVQSIRSAEHEFPALPPAPGPPPFAPLPLPPDPAPRPLSRSRSARSDQSTSQDVFHNISNIDSSRSTGGGGGGGTSSHPSGPGKSVTDSKGGKVTSFGVGPAIGLPRDQGGGHGGASQRSDGSAVLSRLSAGSSASAGPRTTLSNPQNGYTHAPRPPSSTGMLRVHGNSVSESGGSLVMTPESHPLAGPQFGSDAGMHPGWRDEREPVIVMPRGNGIGRNRVGVSRVQGTAEPPRALHHSLPEQDGGDGARTSGGGSSLDEGPKTPATNLRRMTLAGTEGVVVRDVKGVQAKECASQASLHMCMHARSRRTCLLLWGGWIRYGRQSSLCRLTHTLGRIGTPMRPSPQVAMRSKGTGRRVHSHAVPARLAWALQCCLGTPVSCCCVLMLLGRCHCEIRVAAQSESAPVVLQHVQGGDRCTVSSCAGLDVQVPGASTIGCLMLPRRGSTEFSRLGLPVPTFLGGCSLLQRQQAVQVCSSPMARW